MAQLCHAVACAPAEVDGIQLLQGASYEPIVPCVVAVEFTSICGQACDTVPMTVQFMYIFHVIKYFVQHQGRSAYNFIDVSEVK